MEVTRTSENYLKTMLILMKKNGYVRAVDVANRLHITRSSASNAVKQLLGEGYLTLDEHKFIRLTPRGEAIAESALLRHSFYESLLLAAGVRPEQADEDAGEMTKTLSEESFLRLRETMGDHLKAATGSQRG